MPQIKTIVVLGMHRSTTSLIAKGLKECGVNLGRVLIGTHESNPWGHWEDLEFVMLNDEILKSAGGRWDDPPGEQAILNQAGKFADRIESMVKDRNNAVDPKYPLWGWKDPRTTLTIRLYLPFLINPYFHCAFADPLRVAASLCARDGMWLSDGAALAREYNRRLLAFLEEFST